MISPRWPAFLVSGTLPLSEESFAAVKGEREDIVQGMQFALWRLEAQRDWTREPSGMT